MKLRLQGKLLINILTTAVVIYSVAFGYMFYAMNSSTKTNAISITEAIAEKYATEIEQKFNTDFKILSALNNSFLAYPKLNYSMRDKIYDPVLKEVVMQNPQYMSVWYTWELSAIYDTYILPYGRNRIAYYRQDNVKGYRRDSLDLDGDDLGSVYYRLKINPEEVLVDPYYDNYTNNTDDNILMTTVASPIYLKGKFAGIVGIDISLDQIKQISERVIPDRESNSFIISANDKFVTFSSKNYTNQDISVYFEQSEANEIASVRKNFTEKQTLYTKKDGIEYFVTIIPIKFGESNSYWAVGIMTPVSQMLLKVKNVSFVFIIVSTLGVVVLILVIWLFSIRITRPLKKTANIVQDLAKGNISRSQQMDIVSEDEISEIGLSVNELIKSLNKTAEFASEIGKGNLDFDYIPLSESDILGNSLIEMRESLKFAKEEEIKRMEEDRKLNWATIGAAKFSDIMRQYSDNLEGLAYAVISELVKYIDANQGGLFMITEDTKKIKHIDLTASYAFDKRKRMNKRIPFGVGLVGRCILERETIYITQIPSEYINITSGLGEDTPKQLLIVPLIFNQEVFGVVELASFEQIEKYKINFVEQIGEVIASTISMVKINMRTAKLLEETKLKSEEMSAQEEEIRQNMEEMVSSQEELNHKLNEVSNVLEAVKMAAYIAEFDMQGRIIDVNDKFLSILKKDKKDLLGKYQGSFSQEPQNIENFNKFWIRLQSGHIREYKQQIIAGGRRLFIKSIYVPLLDENGDAYKVISVAELEKIE